MANKPLIAMETPPALAFNKRKTGCLKTIFLVILVWLLGLFMGSYLKVNDPPWALKMSIPIPLKYQISNQTTIELSAASKVSKYNVTTTATPVVSTTPKNRPNECNFPILDPVDPKIKKYIKKYPTLTCSSGIPGIVDVVGDELKVNAEKVKAKLKSKPSVIDCKYRSISMAPNTDFKVNFGSWSKTFNNSTRLRKEDINLHVDCYDKKKLISRSYIALVKRKQETEKKRLEDYNQHVKKHAPKETLSVLLVGIDGTAKQNFIRSCPKTKEFILKKMNAIEFHKFNKVGLNTFPNVLPMLTGLHIKELEEKKWTYKTPFDNVNHLFLWDEYQKAGYRTSMVLDMIHITAFHYLKKGWSKPPVDFYPRPITIASEKDTTYRKAGSNCMGDTTEVTLLHDYWVQLTTAYNNTPTTPYFAYSFMAKLTHDDLNKASSADELYLKFFQELVKRSVLNNTLLIFFSDHGERFGSIRNTYNGLVEAKTPFLFFMFPPWFEKKYPDMMHVLRNNTQRLMTMFDVHATLKDLLYFSGKSRNASALDRGISLFSKVPKNRTCDVAGIPMKFCACNTVSRENVTSQNITRPLVDKLVEHIVSLTKKSRDKCEVLKHKDTKHILAMSPEIPLKEKTMTLYHMTIQTTPGDAVYEASVQFKSDTKAVTVLSGIARLDIYKGQAECVDDSTVRPFCFCSKKKKS